jgi:hypothetical protein
MLAQMRLILRTKAAFRTLAQFLERFLKLIGAYRGIPLHGHAAGAAAGHDVFPLLIAEEMEQGGIVLLGGRGSNTNSTPDSLETHSFLGCVARNWRWPVSGHPTFGSPFNPGLVHPPFHSVPS